MSGPIGMVLCAAIGSFLMSISKYGYELYVRTGGFASNADGCPALHCLSDNSIPRMNSYSRFPTLASPERTGKERPEMTETKGNSDDEVFYYSDYHH